MMNVKNHEEEKQGTGERIADQTELPRSAEVKIPKDEFYTYLVEKGKTDDKARQYWSDVDQFLKWCRSSYGTQPQKLYRNHVMEYLARPQPRKPLAENAFHSKMAALRQYNAYLVENGVQPDRVLADVSYRQVLAMYNEPDRLTNEQVEDFRLQIMDQESVRDYAIVTIMAYAGLRLGECLALRLEDVSMPDREITVRPGKVSRTRIVCANDAVMNALEDYLKERPSTDCPYLFISSRGDMMTAKDIRCIFRRHSIVIAPHHLRHFFINTFLAESSMEDLTKILGCSGGSGSALTSIYIHRGRK